MSWANLALMLCKRRPNDLQTENRGENNPGPPQSQQKASLYNWRPRKISRFPICGPRSVCCPPREARDHDPSHNANPWATGCSGVGLLLSDAVQALQERSCSWGFQHSQQRQSHRHSHPEHASLMKFCHSILQVLNPEAVWKCFLSNHSYRAN